MHKVLQELSQDNECLHPWKGRLKFSRLETQSHATLLPSEHYYPAVHSQLRQLSSCISLCTLFAEPRIDKQVNWNKMQRSVRTQTFFIHSSKADMLYSLMADTAAMMAMQLNSTHLDWTGLDSTRPPPPAKKLVQLFSHFTDEKNKD